ncbi:hypothetical protein F2Q70_00006906 [Brassica cretica]|uniref:Uncharacterized protein n=1 Tax=Brassica cretica TaxID=69181 RepID=A0A8S9FUM8_BRACR|nr:hypothetical protein F2Q68_00023580 [Brassica cretica]KAF2575410.1 hypothetical protein F2Q70_00006906 [Brassica cretica]
MEGLIPFLYKAIVMYKRERSLSSVLFSDHDSPSTAGYYMRLPGDSSLILDLRLSGDSDQNVMICSKESCLAIARDITMFLRRDYDE